MAVQPNIKVCDTFVTYFFLALVRLCILFPKLNCCMQCHLLGLLPLFYGQLVFYHIIFYPAQ